MIENIAVTAVLLVYLGLIAFVFWARNPKGPRLDVYVAIWRTEYAFYYAGSVVQVPETDDVFYAAKSSDLSLEDAKLWASRLNEGCS